MNHYHIIAASSHALAVEAACDTTRSGFAGTENDFPACLTCLHNFVLGEFVPDVLGDLASMNTQRKSSLSDIDIMLLSPWEQAFCQLL